MSSIVEQFDYSQVAVPSASYRMRNVVPDAPVVGNLASTFESSFTLPRMNVFNLARSELVFTLQALTSAEDKKAVVGDIGVLPFDRFQIRTERGLILADYNYVRSLSRLRPLFKNYDSLMAHSTVYPTPAAATNAVGSYGAQDGTTRLEPAGRLILSDTASAAAKASGNGYKGYAGATLDFEKAFGTYRQFVVSDASNAAASTHINVDYRIPLSEFFGITELDKDLYFASEALIITFTHSPINRIFFQGSDSDGTTELATAIAAGNDYCRNVSLQLAIQSNNMLANNIISRVNTEGLSISYPMVWVQRRITDNTATHTELMRLNISKGKYLQRAVYFLETDAVATGFTNTTNNHSAAGVGARWTGVRTSVNSVWESDKVLTTLEAYNLNKNHLENSMVVSKRGWDRVGAYMVDYTSAKSPDEFNRRVQDATGLNLMEPVDLNTEWTKTSGVGSIMNVYTAVWCQKDIRLTAAGVIEA